MHIDAACPLDHRERNIDDDDYIAWLQKVLKECLHPVLDQLRESFGSRYCRDEVVSESIKRLLIAGRAHGPWDVPNERTMGRTQSLDNVNVYIRGKPGKVFIHMDYCSPRLVASTSTLRCTAGSHVQKQTFKLDDYNCFFSCQSDYQRKIENLKNAIQIIIAELHVVDELGADFALNDVAQRMLNEFPNLSNPFRKYRVVKAEVADLIRRQLNRGAEPHVPRTTDAPMRVSLLRMKRDCSRDALFSSAFGRECKNKGLYMEPCWAKGAIDFVGISNPWSLPLDRIERYHALVLETEVELFSEALRDAFPYNRRPRFETVDTLTIARETLTETMRGYANMLRDGSELDTKTYTQLIDMCCKQGEYQNAYILLREMENKGIHPSAVTFNCMLSMYNRGLGSAKKAERLMLRMDRYGLTPTVYAYNVVIKAYKKKGHSIKIEEWQQKKASQYPCSRKNTCASA